MTGLKIACRVCSSTTKKFLELGQQPVANRFKDDILSREEKYFLDVVFCPDCFTIQIGKCPDVANVYTDEYPFFTSSSDYMIKHFNELAEYIKRVYLPTFFPVIPGGAREPQANGFIVEIGSNDGTFLKNFTNIPHLGIEPAGNVRSEAIKNGVQCWDSFFDVGVAGAIVQSMGKADVVVSTNVFGHIPNRNSTLQGISDLLKEGGIWINEEAYLGDILEKISYDQFYNEHIFYSTVASFKQALDRHDLGIFDVDFYNVHGGSVRYFVSHKRNMSESAASKKVDHLIDVENLYSFDRLKHFAVEVKRSKHKILGQLHMIKSWGGEIVGYGASAKSTTILNYCGIDRDLIPVIYDTTKEKHHKFCPGTNIQVMPHYHFNGHNPTNVVLFIWNHASEVYKKEGFKERNWIIPIGN